MRRNDEKKQQPEIFTYLSLEERAPADHPLRAVHQLADQVLQEMSDEFDKAYRSEAGHRLCLSGCSAR